MTVEKNTAAHAETHAELLAQLAGSICTRSLNRFAQESRQDGESLMDAVERYEIDYAWHVLASDRMRDASLALLEAKLGQPASDAHKRCVADVLSAAAAGQASELLMSFDSDVPERLATLLCERHERMTKREAVAGTRDLWIRPSDTRPSACSGTTPSSCRSRGASPWHPRPACSCPDAPASRCIRPCRLARC